MATDLHADLHQLRRVHLVGISGAGMLALAQALLASGIHVSGSDADIEKARKSLCTAELFEGHGSHHLPLDTDVVVASTAISLDNPELVAARQRSVPIWHRSHMLGWFLRRHASILIAGTHGKTTTTTLVGLLLEKAGADPWCFVGGSVREFGGNVRVGKSSIAVAEADESDGSFLNLPRTHAIITNIEAEHLNHWKDMNGLLQGFTELVEEMAPHGTLVLCADDPGVQQLLDHIDRSHITYSIEHSAADYFVRRVRLRGDGSTFELHSQHGLLCHVSLGIPGRHNVANATAAFALVHQLGFDVEILAAALREFRGVDRRFTRRFAPQGHLVIDDYAHHPTEIAVTAAAARTVAHERGGRLYGVFQPHRYSRIADLFDDFERCFASFDHLIVMDIYSGGETPIAGVTGLLFFEKLRTQYKLPMGFAETLEDVKKALLPMLNFNDTVLLLGAGSVTKLATLLTVPVETYPLTLMEASHEEATGALRPRLESQDAWSRALPTS